MQIDLHGKLELYSVLEECKVCDYEVCDFVVGNDDMIHILLTRKAMEWENRKCYQTISMMVDWQDGSFVGYEKTDFGVLKHDFHYIQRIHDGFLLLGARARYDVEAPECNAMITDRTGTAIAHYCFGDGIQQCLVDNQNRIVTSYFDEGVFGSNGWNNPMGSCGVILWSAEGECLWKNTEYSICDCYAINLDQQDRLWFYYYTAFDLVCTDYHNDIVYKPALSGSSAFLIHSKGGQIVFSAGYGKRGKYIMKKIRGTSLGTGEEVKFVYNGKAVWGQSSFRGAKALFLDRKNNLYYGVW